MNRENEAAASGGSELALGHLRRDARTALELALVALAPSDVIDELAVIAGLLEAVEQLPRDSPPIVARMPGLVQRAHKALKTWKAWHADHLAKINA